MKLFFCLLLSSAAWILNCNEAVTKPIVQTDTLRVKDTVIDTIDGKIIIGDFAPLQKGYRWSYSILSGSSQGRALPFTSNHDSGIVMVIVGDKVNSGIKINVIVDIVKINQVDTLIDTTRYHNDTTYTLIDSDSAVYVDSITGALHFDGILPFYSSHFVEARLLSRENYNGKNEFALDTLGYMASVSHRHYISNVGLTLYDYHITGNGWHNSSTMSLIQFSQP
jgi:hypothetical protein